MAVQEQIRNQEPILNSSANIPTTDRIESLRIILEAQQHRPIPYEEAADVGDSLLSFFRVLAEDAVNNSDNPYEGAASQSIGAT